MALSRGFMVATSSMNVLGNNCNTVTSAESAMMLKERIAERYGSIRYTIGTGCSGGSIGQHTVANAYPGLVDGIRPLERYGLDLVEIRFDLLRCFEELVCQIAVSDDQPTDH